MLADFNKFKNNNTPNAEIPQSVLDSIGEEIPHNFSIIKTKDEYMMSPDPDKVKDDGIILRVTFGEETYEAFKGCPPEKILTYSYHLQKPVPLKAAKIGDKDKLIPLEKASVPLFHDEALFKEGVLYPPKFNPPYTITLEDGEGDKASIQMQQQVYDSWEETKISNITFPALTIDLYFNESDVKKSRITYSVTPSKASTTKEALMAARLFRGFLNGTTKVNGLNFTPSGKIEKDFDKNQIDDVVSSWEETYNFERKLSVNFNPTAKMTQQESKLFSEVSYSILHDDFVQWKNAVSHFHVKGFVLSKPDDSANGVDDTKGENANNKFAEVSTNIGLVDLPKYAKNESMKYQYMDGPLDMNFMGASFKVYCLTELEDFLISRVEMDEGSSTDGTIFIKKINEKKPILLKKKYITETDYEKAIEDS